MCEFSNCQLSRLHAEITNIASHVGIQIEATVLDKFRLNLWSGYGGKSFILVRKLNAKTEFTPEEGFILQLF